MRVSKNQFRAAVGIVALAGLAMSTSALAAPVTCSENTARNHMIIDDQVINGELVATVTDCLGAGTGNLTGENHNDLFLIGTEGGGYEAAGKSDEPNLFTISFTQVQPNGSTTGTFSFDDSFWVDAVSGAIGFQFGTGNRSDEWFVFELAHGVTSGSFEFVNMVGRGGGLSHVNLYRVPEPSGLVMLGLGVFGAGLVRRRAKPV